jgi:hypothetical protein
MTTKIITEVITKIDSIQTKVGAILKKSGD